MKPPIWLDTTLRDGLQAPGLNPSLQTRQEIFLLLRELGLTHLEVGIPSRSPGEKAFVNWCAGQPGVEITAWNRLREEDLEASMGTGAQVHHLAVPGGGLYRQAFGQVPDRDLLAEISRLGALVRRSGGRFSVGIEDAPACPLEFLSEAVLAAKEAGALRIRYADSLGVLTPSQIKSRLEPLLALGLPVDFHGHNDLGLASANALAAWEAGVQVLSTTLGGLGERGGHTALEEVAGAIEWTAGVDSGVSWKNLTHTARSIYFLLGQSIPPHKPLLGEKIFCHEAGLHAELLARTGKASSLEPQDLGRIHQTPLSPHSGRGTLARYLRSRGRDLPPDKLRALHNAWTAYWDSAPDPTPPAQDVLMALLDAQPLEEQHA